MKKKFYGFEKRISKTNGNEDLKAEVLDNAGDLFNDWYYAHKKYEEKKMI